MGSDLDAQIDQLLTTVVGMGERTDAMLRAALGALAAPDSGSADLVPETDELVDQAYREVQNGVLTLIALHGPVGRELRTLTGLIHVSLHLERMGDYATNVARTAGSVAAEHSEPDLIDQLTEMGDLAREVGREALRSFVVSDVELANEALRRDDGVDRLNLGIFHRLVRLAAQDDVRVEWAARMIQVTRQLERYADHGVDIAEMTAFVDGTELRADDPPAGDGTAPAS